MALPKGFGEWEYNTLVWGWDEGASRVLPRFYLDECHNKERNGIEGRDVYRRENKMLILDPLQVFHGYSWDDLG